MKKIGIGYENYTETIRGLKKITMYLTVTFLIYMTLAKIKIENGQKEHLCKMYA